MTSAAFRIGSTVAQPVAASTVPGLARVGLGSIDAGSTAPSYQTPLLRSVAPTFIYPGFGRDPDLSTPTTTADAGGTPTAEVIHSTVGGAGPTISNALTPAQMVVVPTNSGDTSGGEGNLSPAQPGTALAPGLAGGLGGGTSTGKGGLIPGLQGLANLAGYGTGPGLLAPNTSLGSTTSTDDTGTSTTSNATGPNIGGTIGGTLGSLGGGFLGGLGGRAAGNIAGNVIGLGNQTNMSATPGTGFAPPGLAAAIANAPTGGSIIGPNATGSTGGGSADAGAGAGSSSANAAGGGAASSGAASGSGSSTGSGTSDQQGTGQGVSGAPAGGTDTAAAQAGPGTTGTGTGPAGTGAGPSAGPASSGPASAGVSSSMNGASQPSQGIGTSDPAATPAAGPSPNDVGIADPTPSAPAAAPAAPSPNDVGLTDQTPTSDVPSAAPSPSDNDFGPPAPTSDLMSGDPPAANPTDVAVADLGLDPGLADTGIGDGDDGGDDSGTGGGDDSGGNDGGASGGGGANGGGDNGGGWAQGGPVTAARLIGPNPAGPDDGYGALKAGEYVIRAPEVARYANILAAINNGTFNPRSNIMAQPTIGPAATGAYPGAQSQTDGSSLDPLHGPVDARAPAQPWATGGDTGSSDVEGDETDGDEEYDDGAPSPLAPASGTADLTPDLAMQRMAGLSPDQRQALSSVMSDPNAAGALLSIMGPGFTPVLQAVMAGSPMAAAPGGPGGMPPAMTSGMPPMPPPGAGLGGINS